MSEPVFNPRAMVKVLLEHRVAFVIVGGYAAELQGVSWMTLDVDIVIQAEPAENARLPANGLRSLARAAAKRVVAAVQRHPQDGQTCVRALHGRHTHERVCGWTEAHAAPRGKDCPCLISALL